MFVVVLVPVVVEVVVRWVGGIGVEKWEAADMAKLRYFEACGGAELWGTVAELQREQLL